MTLKDDEEVLTESESIPGGGRKYIITNSRLEISGELALNRVQKDDGTRRGRTRRHTKAH